jgi:hypothetical protein
MYVRPRGIAGALRLAFVRATQRGPAESA